MNDIMVIMTSIPDFRLEVFFQRWEFDARYHLTASDVETLTIGELLEMATPEDRDAFFNLRLGYTETFGAPDLRELIAGTYDSMNVKNILCFAGAEEGMYVAFQCLLEKDDHAITVTPNYQSAESIPAALCSVTGIPLDPDQNWTLDMDRLKAAIQPNTKLIAINFPHNPTGKILELNKYLELIDICRAHGIWLFSDEVYRLIGVTGTPHLPQAADVYERGLSLGVMSKAYGLPGLRIGWIACQDEAVLQKLERLKHYLSICNSAPSERLSVIALKCREKILERNNTLMATNLAELDAFFAEFPDQFDWYRPDGGCVAYPRYKGAEGADHFTNQLLEETGVLLLPPRIYQSDLNPTPTDRFRIGYGRANISEGLSVFRAWLNRNRA